MIKLKNFILKYSILILAFLSFLIPFIIYLLTLERKLVGGDTSWYALQIPKMQIFVPTGYPTFSLLGKLITYLPVGDLAYRLNLFSAIFGALTILFLFLSINKLVKNELISLISSFTFAFVYPFWSVANRLEFDTLNSFFIALVVFSALLYNGSRERNHLYFFFFCLGLSLTNHPIAFFITPAFLIYIIIINPRIFRNLKVIPISLLCFILPLLSYIYLPIRSLQGYGSVTSFKTFIYYVTGRTTSGKIHGGSFGDRPISTAFEAFKDYLDIIYKNYGIILIILSIIGFVYLIKKNKKFAISSLLLIIFNLAIITQYIGWAVPNYVLNIMLIMSIYISFGFLLIIGSIKFVFEKLLSNKKILKIDNILKYFSLSIIFLFFAFQPFSLIYANYNRVDRSEPGDVYKFWDKAIDNMEEDSILYVLALSSNVGMFVNEYEYGDKEIEFIYHNNPKYSVDDMVESLEKDVPVYFVGNRSFLKLQFNTERIGKQYYWPRYKEFLELYKVVNPKVNIKIEYVIDGYSKKFGEKFTVEYVIRNKNKERVGISSLELELPDNIELVEVEPEGYINQDPGISRGMYMWVGDSYVIEAEDEINLILKLRGTRPGKSQVKFRITTHDVYINSDDIEIEIKG